MKRFTMLFALVALCATFVTTAFAGPDEDAEARALVQSEAAAVSAAQWDLFSDNLVRALKSDYESIRLSAMQLVIRYGDQVDVDPAVFEVVRLYRDHKNTDVRRMAVVALGKMENRWAMDFLARSEGYEKNPEVRQTIQAVLADYTAKTPANFVAKVGA